MMLQYSALTFNSNTDGEKGYWVSYFVEQQGILGLESIFREHALSSESLDIRICYECMPQHASYPEKDTQEKIGKSRRSSSQ